MTITAILTGHREGLLAGPSIASFLEAIEHARGAGLTVEPLIILDRPDDLTRNLFQEREDLARYLVICDYGDPALSRSRGVGESKGDFVTFLDADDLWSYNWITSARNLVHSQAEKVIGHSEFNIIFGDEVLLWAHADSTWPEFDFTYLRISNYWDALCFAPRSVFDEYPMRKNDVANGYGHEDWHWNALTYSAGYHHRPIPDTIHFKRRRGGSQSAQCNGAGVVIWPTPLARFAWKPL